MKTLKMLLIALVFGSAVLSNAKADFRYTTSQVCDHFSQNLSLCSAVDFCYAATTPGLCHAPAGANDFTVAICAGYSTDADGCARQTQYGCSFIPGSDRCAARRTNL